MSKVKLCYFLPLMLLLALFAGFFSPDIANAQQSERGILLSTTHPGITIVRNQRVTLPIKVTNRGKVDEQIDIIISSAPQGWVTELLNIESGTAYGVRRLYVAAGEEAPLIYFTARPPAGAALSEQTFLIEAVSQDGQVKASLKLAIRVEERAAALSRVKLTVAYPDLRGATALGFKYKIDVTNEGSEDLTFSFSAETPERWEVSFNPAYEVTLITTMGIKAGETKGIEVALTPPKYVSPGKYAIKITAASGAVTGTTDLTATVLEEVREPSYELELLTLSGRLNIEAVAGQASYLSLLITNRGSGELTKSNFYSTKPEGWIITFDPETIESMVAGESREVRVAITPASKTIAGDYSVNLRASSSEDSDKVDLRVTVGTATIWGWVGLGIVLMVIAGMVTVFWRLGRR